MYNGKRKYNKTFAEIGKKEYEFDFCLEKIIYKDLCCLHLTSKEKKICVQRQTFARYRDWKDYIVKKYKETDKETLIEFSRYLNQRLRNRESSQDYWKLAIPVILTFGITDFFSFLLQSLNGMIVKNWNYMNAIGVLIAVVCFMIFVLGLIWNTMDPIWESRTEKNFLNDYKEIIDEMIKEN